MEINLHLPKLPEVPYFVLSVALDVLAAGLGVLGGAENAMLAVKSKRGVEAFVRRSADKLAEWRGNAQPELAPIDERDTARSEAPGAPAATRMAVPTRPTVTRPPATARLTSEVVCPFTERW